LLVKCEANCEEEEGLMKAMRDEAALDEEMAALDQAKDILSQKVVVLAQTGSRVHRDEADKRETGMTDDSSRGPKTRSVHRFSRGLMLGIAFASTAGGIATLNGSPAHLVLSGSSILDGTLTYGEWLLFGFPISACT